MNITNQKFLVTGGSGFIGSHIVDLLLAEGASEVIVFDKLVRNSNLIDSLSSGRVRIEQGDITDVACLEKIMQGIDGVFHLAVLPIGPCVNNPRACVDINIVGTFNVIESAHKAGVKKIIFSSASSVYGDTLETMDETHPLNAKSIYGGSKIAGEYLFRAFYDMYKLNYVILRYMNVYGPRQEGGLISNVLGRIRQNLPPTIVGDGSASFDFIHVKDVAKANIAAMKSEITDEVFNVGSGTEASVKQIVELLLLNSGSSLKPEYKTDQKVLMFRRVGSNNKLVKKMNWKPTISLADGLKDLIG